MNRHSRRGCCAAASSAMQLPSACKAQLHVHTLCPAKCSSSTSRIAASRHLERREIGGGRELAQRRQAEQGRGRGLARCQRTDCARASQLPQAARSCQPSEGASALQAAGAVRSGGGADLRLRRQAAQQAGAQPRQPLPERHAGSAVAPLLKPLEPADRRQQQGQQRSGRPPAAHKPVCEVCAPTRAPPGEAWLTQQGLTSSDPPKRCSPRAGGATNCEIAGDAGRATRDRPPRHCLMQCAEGLAFGVLPALLHSPDARKAVLSHTRCPGCHMQARRARQAAAVSAAVAAAPSSPRVDCRLPASQAVHTAITQPHSVGMR